MGRGPQDKDSLFEEADDQQAPVLNTDLLQAAIGNVAVPVFIINNSREYVECNQKACDILGLSREELLQLRIDDIAISRPENNFTDIFARLISKGEVENQQLKIKTPRGKSLRVTFTAKANIVPGLHISTWTSVEEEETLPDKMRLTPRECDVMQQLALGEDYKGAGRKLSLSPETVRTHSRSARLKLGARSRDHAVVLAIESGQIEGEDSY